MTKAKKGVTVQRPGEKAGQACEGPGCERTECSRWLAAGRCCTSLECQAYFGVGKGKAVEAAAAASKEEEAWNAVKKQKHVHSPAAKPALKPWRAPLEPGEMLLELGADDVEKNYFDEFEVEDMDGLRGLGTLDTSQPFTVLNVRLDEYGGQPDWSFLIAGIVRRGERHETMLHETRWVCWSVDTQTWTGVDVVPAAVDFMQANGAHAEDVARLRAMFKEVCDNQWEKKESGGKVWYYNDRTGQTTWTEPEKYWDDYWSGLTGEQVVNV